MRGEPGTKDPPYGFHLLPNHSPAHCWKHFHSMFHVKLLITDLAKILRTGNGRKRGMGLMGSADTMRIKNK